MVLTRGLLSLKSNVFTSAESVKADLIHRRLDAQIPASLRRLCQVNSTTIDGCTVITLSPRSKNRGIDLLYIHGGAYVHPIVTAHWHIIQRLIEHTGATVTVPSYGLAPEHTLTEGYTLLETVYRQLIDRAGGKPVYVSGDSAGGGLSLGLAITCRDRGIRLPDGLFLFSPFLDATLTNPAIESLRPLDPMLDVAGLRWCGEQWATDGISLTDPRISPIYDSLANLPPIHIYQGGHDIFAADAQKFAQKAASTNTPVVLEMYPEGFHVFVGATFTAEAADVFRRVGQVVGRV